MERNQIRLASFIRRYFGGTMIQALKTVIPVKSVKKALEKKKIYLNINKEEAISLLGECIRKKQKAKARLLTELIQDGELPYEIVTGKLMISTVSLKSLETNGIIRIETFTELRNPIKGHLVTPQTLQLSDEQEKIVTEIIEDYKRNKPEIGRAHV